MSALLRRLLGREPTLADGTPADAKPMAMLHAASFTRGWSDGEFAQLLADRAVVGDRARIGSRLVGFIVSRVAADEAEILSVAVAARQRGRGIARGLLDRNLRRLAGRGVRKVFLEVEAQNMAAITLYRRAGFAEVGRRPGYYTDAAGRPAAALVLARALD